MATPKLRFKNFDDNLNTTVFQEYIASSKYGPRFDANDYDENGNVKTIRGTDVALNASIKYEQVPLAKLPSKLIEEHQLKNGDILMITTADCGLSAVFEEQDTPFIASAYAVRICLKESMDSIWVKYYLQTQHIVNEVNKYVRKGTLSNLPLSDISKFNVSVPSKEEQTRIASFLSAVDEKISQLTQKYELLSQYKQGMMQKLFSQQIRFKADDGSEFGKWEIKSIKDVADVKGGKRIPKGYMLVSENTGHPYITVSDMNRSYSIDSTNIRYVPLEVVDTIKRYTITDKDIFISVAGTLGIIGKIPTEFNGANLTENADKLTNLKCHQDFLIYLLDSGYLSALIESTATTSAQPKLALYAIEQLEIQMPCLAEQTKIANFLSAIDQKIEVVAQQIEQAKTWKKGLLQQMFV